MVAAELITSEEAEVIIATRLEGISDREVAAAARPPYTLCKRRLRAEHKVAAYLGCTNTSTSTSAEAVHPGPGRSWLPADNRDS